MTRSSNKDIIVVAIDFGTTYSGAAFTYRGKPAPAESMPLVKGWAEGSNQNMVPTELRYEISTSDPPRPSRKRKAAGGITRLQSSNISTNVVEWGFEVDREQDYIRFVKLLLDKRQKFPPYVDRNDLEALLKRAGKTPFDVVADYLSKMREAVLEDIGNTFGKTMMVHTKLELVLTVPAIWSDAAKYATRTAAEKAGWSTKDQFFMVSEPEAAAICAIKQSDGVNVAPGDIWVIVDAGGGTVDAISYEIVSQSPLRLRESVAGVGDICGSGLLNMRFEECVAQRMGRGEFDKYRQKNHRAWKSSRDHFEDRTKRDFNPFRSPKKEYHVPLFGASDNLSAGIVDNYLVLTSADLRGIFEPVIQATIKLIDQQYNSLVQAKKPPRGIILVGGFGESRYLHKTLEHFYGEKTPGLEVRQLSNAQSAVVRGAVIYALENDGLVLSRVARRHYGVATKLPFDETKHPACKKFWDECNEKFYIDNQIEWYIKKNQPLPSGHTVILPFHITGQQPLVQGDVELVESDEDEAPDEFEKTAMTRTSCTISADLIGVPLKRWRHNSTDSGRQYYTLDYSVGMTVSSASIKFDMRVGKVVYGTAKVDYI